MSDDSTQSGYANKEHQTNYLHSSDANSHSVLRNWQHSIPVYFKVVSVTDKSRSAYPPQAGTLNFTNSKLMLAYIAQILLAGAIPQENVQ